MKGPDRVSGKRSGVAITSHVSAESPSLGPSLTTTSAISTSSRACLPRFLSIHRVFSPSSPQEDMDSQPAASGHEISRESRSNHVKTMPHS